MEIHIKFERFEEFWGNLRKFKRKYLEEIKKTRENQRNFPNQKKLILPHLSEHLQIDFLEHNESFLHKSKIPLAENH